MSVGGRAEPELYDVPSSVGREPPVVARGPRLVRDEPRNDIGRDPGPGRVGRQVFPVVPRPVPGTYRCVSVTRPAAFHALEARWRDLWAHSASPSPFFSWDFVVEWWRAFVHAKAGGATGEIEVVVVLDAEGQTVAIAPFFVESNLGVAAFGTILQPFGRSNSFEAMTDEPVATVELPVRVPYGFHGSWMAATS